MSVEPLKGFRELETDHCISGSLRYIYDYYQHPISEDMLLGLGEGVGFIYWHMKGTIPFIGGRANFTRPGMEGQERKTGRRTGVGVEIFQTSSSKKAQQTMKAMLEDGQPVMIMCDMGYLPYMDFGGEPYHFGGHAVVVCGYDLEWQDVLVADRDGFHTVSMESLMQARGSVYKPYPPKHQWYQFDFSQKRLPTQDELRAALKGQVEGMLKPAISNMGVSGIKKAARRIKQWPGVLNEKDLRFSMFNTYIFIDAAGGTGGGIFRYMLSRFIRECAAQLGQPDLEKCADAFMDIGDRWQAVATLFRQGWDADDPAAVLMQTIEPVEEIAELEAAAWSLLGNCV